MIQGRRFGGAADGLQFLLHHGPLLPLPPLRGLPLL